MNLLTALLLLGSIATLQLSRSGEAVGPLLVSGAIGFILALLARVVFSRVDERRGRIIAGSQLGVAVIGLVVGSMLDLVRMAPEELMLTIMLVAAGACFATGDRTNLARCAMLSIVGVVFALPGVDLSHRLPVVLSAAALGAVWLMVTRAEAGVPSMRTGWVARNAAIVVVVAGVCVGVDRLIDPTDTNPWYAAWAPTSGGPGEGDDTARSGIGDGPDEIASEQADSVGFDASDTFSESARDGLYDLWIESYGEPVRSDRQQKMIGLRPDDVRTAAASDRENLSVGRSFDLRRRPTDRPAMQRDDVGADARVFIKGPMPVYLPLATFNDFADDAWIAADAPVDASPVRPDERPGWMHVLQRPISPSFAGTQQHEIRIGDLGGSILPTPPLVERFRMGRINRSEFFGSTRSGLLRLARRSLPAGATMIVESKTVSAQRLVNVEPALPRHSDPALLRSSADARVQALAREWAGDRERGWRQIEQVVARLRDHVTLSSDAPSMSESTVPNAVIDELLFGTRIGRDCDIASAAVMLLRTLGYPTRLVSGLYADADAIDPDSGFASLDGRAVRFWIEIRLADGSWITVDPIPGFPMLNLPRSTGEWVTAVWDRTLLALSAQPLLLAMMIALPIGLFVLRRPIVDALVTARCRLRGHAPQEVLRVIETRARLAGTPRPPGAPVGQWVERLDPKLRDSGFVSALNRALYASPATSDPSIGRAALKQLTRRTIRQRTPEAP